MISDSAIPRITMPDGLRSALSAADVPSTTALGDKASQELAVARLRSQVARFDEFMSLAAEMTSSSGGVIIENCAVGSDAVIAVLSACLGYVDPLGNGIPPRLVFDVTPRRDEHGGVSMAGSSRGAGYFGLHSDSASFAVPHSHVVLACVRSRAGAGGQSILVSADAIASALRAVSPSSLAVLADPVFPFIGSGFSQPSDVVSAPVLEHDGARWQVRYTRQCIVDGLRYRSLDDQHRQALSDFESVLADPALAAEFTLLPGDLWILENRRWLHGRRAIDAGSDRLLKRCKVYT
jgi:hypothetical protein